MCRNKKGDVWFNVAHAIKISVPRHFFVAQPLYLYDPTHSELFGGGHGHLASGNTMYVIMYVLEPMSYIYI